MKTIETFSSIIKPVQQNSPDREQRGRWNEPAVQYESVPVQIFGVNNTITIYKGNISPL
jgi:hypothetical protein